MRRSDSIATVTLSLNDVINVERLEAQRRVANGGRTLFVNTHTASTTSLSPSLLTPDSMVSTSKSSEPDDEWKTNAKHVGTRPANSYVHIGTDTVAGALC